jgi:hypothetical protein
MAGVTTTVSSTTVAALIDGVADERRRRDAKTVLKLMKDVTGIKPKVWGTSMIGFGSYDYTYDSGHSGTSLLIGFAPRKANLVLYVLDGTDTFDDLLATLGPHKTGKGCLYLTNLEKNDLDVLRAIVERSFAAKVARAGDTATLR